MSGGGQMVSTPCCGWIRRLPRTHVLRERRCKLNQRQYVAMTAHPCADHPCDHCYCCDVIGICCQKISTEQRARLEAGAEAPEDRLRAAIVQAASAVPSLSELVRQTTGQPAALSATVRLHLSAAPAADLLSPDPRKEAIRVLLARSE